jgi:diguanylate cyclase (GGDEF)-like protein
MEPRRIASPEEILAEYQEIKVELSAFTGVAKALTTARSLEDILETLMRVVQQLLKPRNWSLLLYDRKKRLTFRLIQGIDQEKLKGISLNRGQGIAGTVAETGESILVGDVSTDPRHYEGIDELVGFKTKSIIAVPIRIGKRILGVIELVNKLGDDTFTGRDLALLTTLADFTAVGIQNANYLRRLRSLTTRDQLTGARNSRFLDAMLSRELQRGKTSGVPVSVIFADLDDLKLVNDTHGHLAGDRLLHAFVRFLDQHTRPVDRVCRYAGDEFVIVCPSCDHAQCVSLEESIRDGLSRARFRLGSHEIRLSASLGSASFPEHGQTVASLIHHADQEMYSRKREKKAARGS